MIVLSSMKVISGESGCSRMNVVSLEFVVVSMAMVSNYYFGCSSFECDEFLIKLMEECGWIVLDDDECC
jgi:hypothetical protein